MEEQLISFETAKLAKEKGFGERPTGYYDAEGQFIIDTEYLKRHPKGSIVDLNWNEFEDKYSAPSQSLLQRWLREKHDNIVVVLPYNDNYRKKKWEVLVEKNSITYSGCDSYEEALEKGLQEALNLIEKQK